MDDAAEMTELSTLPAFAFFARSIILFGDQNKKPQDHYELGEKYGSVQNLYPTVFHRFLKMGKDRVLNLMNNNPERPSRH